MSAEGTEGLEPRVIYEDDSLVAILKPPRMHSAPGSAGGDLCGWAFERYPEAREAGAGPGGEATGAGAGGRARAPGEGGLLHRLDFETSGIVLFARDSQAFGSLLDQQRRGLFRKEYLALSSISREGMPEGSSPARGLPFGIEEAAWASSRERLDGDSLAALISGAAGSRDLFVECAFRSFGPRGSRVACLGPGEGRGRGGDVYRSDILACSAASRGLGLRVGLFRGFRHQVRAQLAWLGLPVLGDPLYGGAPDERLRLYATTLSFAHPVSGKPITLSAEPYTAGNVAFAAQPL
jgi:23S rRNA-/tRNA-specific pseudouridylate synthase